MGQALGLIAAFGPIGSLKGITPTHTQMATSNPPTERPGREPEGQWYPWSGGHQGATETAVSILLREQRLEYETKLLSMRQELMSVRQEMLGLKESMLRLTEDYNKVRPLIDERKRNALLRKHQPFPWVPEHSRPESRSGDGQRPMINSPSAAELSKQ